MGGAAAGGMGPSQWVWGLTLDDAGQWDADRTEIVEAIGSFSQDMMTRIVFDEYVAATVYDAAVREIAKSCQVMGELVDSFYVKDYSVAEYVARANEYLDQLGDVVAVWEIGNEINGEWVKGAGSNAEVVAKIEGAYDAVKAKGGKTALTLYYNGAYDGGVATANNCWSQPEHHMTTWASKHVPEAMKAGLDYVWVSYYEDDCEDIQPDWQAVFVELAQLFPNSALGIGECGTTKATKKAAYMQRYYRDLIVDHERFVGGFFWWYGRQDVVPKSKPLWQTLQDAMNDH